MNVYIADRIARQHADALMEDAAAARRVRQVRKSRRAARRTSSNEGSAEQPAEQSRRTARAGTATAQFVARPFTVFHAWLAAGQL
jgi:hypothetical protein